MRNASSRVMGAVLVAALSGSLFAQGGGTTMGADVIVGDLNGIASYGSSGNIAAFAIGTTSCNIGTQDLLWIASTSDHPVIGQNMYRIKNGVFEMIGMSHLKHGFTALRQNLCGTCNGNGGSVLGVGCSDPYGASLNGSQGGLGPRYEVNAATGQFPYPFTSNSPSSGTIARRLQIQHADLDPSLNVGSIYLGEGHYVTPDDAAAGNKNNNASYRRVVFSPSGGSYNASFSGGTVRQKTAIEGWRDFDPTVTLSYEDIPNDGRFIIGHKAIAIGGGLTRHVYAVHNFTSDRSAGAFNVDLPAGAVAQNFTFTDVDYHSGSPINGTDWNQSRTGDRLTWACTETFQQNQWANAIRWGTTYTFTFESDATPLGTSIDLFKPEPCPPQPTWPAVGGNYTLVQNAPYDFVTFAGGSAGPTGDDSAITVNLPFTFPFYGQTFTQIQISSNGYLCIPGADGRVYNNDPIPSGNQPNGLIAGCWDDLNPSRGGSGPITYATVAGPNGPRFVVDYNGLLPYSGSGSFTFQIILDGNGDITTTFVNITSAGASATVGIEAPDGQTGLQASFNQPQLTNGTSWVFRRGLPGNIPTSADLVLTGDGSPNSNLSLDLLSTPNSGVIVGIDNDAGPTSLGALGSLDLGISPNFFTIADITGMFPTVGAPALTDRCGVWGWSINVGPLGLPSGLTLHAQAIIPDPNAPNGQFHISNSETLIVP